MSINITNAFTVSLEVDPLLGRNVGLSQASLKKAGMTVSTTVPHITVLKFDSTGFSSVFFRQGCSRLIQYLSQDLLKVPLPPVMIDVRHTGCFFQSDVVHLHVSSIPVLTILHGKIYCEANRIFGVLFDKIYRPGFWAPHISLSKENVVIDAMMNVNLPLRGHATSIKHIWHFGSSDYSGSVPLPQPPASVPLPQPPAVTEVIDKVQEETTKSCTEGKPPGVGRGRGSGREDGGGRSAKGVGRSEADEASEGIGGGRGRGGPDGKDGGHGHH